MATASLLKIYPTGSHKRTVTEITMDSSYPTGGEVITPEQLGLNNCEAAIANIKTVTDSGVNMASVCAIPQTNGGIKLKVNNETPAEVTSTNSLANAVIQVTAWGV